MRFKITLYEERNRELSLPLDYREYLTAAIYGYLGQADQEFARFLHDDGYHGPSGDNRRYKMFTYSRLEAPASRRRIDKERDRIVYSPGPIDWFLSSPVEDFNRHVAGGMLARGGLRLGTASLRIDTIQVLSAPVFREEMRFTCLSPIVASRPVPKSEGSTHFIRPQDDPSGFSEVIRRNLIAKYQILHGSDPDDSRFEMTFDPDYLVRHRGGTKLTNIKGISIVGIQAPFKASGNPALIEVGYQAGFGSKTGLGHGFVEVRG